MSETRTLLVLEVRGIRIRLRGVTTDAIESIEDLDPDHDGEEIFIDTITEAVPT